VPEKFDADFHSANHSAANPREERRPYDDAVDTLFLKPI